MSDFSLGSEVVGVSGSSKTEPRRAANWVWSLVLGFRQLSEGSATESLLALKADLKADLTHGWRSARLDERFPSDLQGGCISSESFAGTGEGFGTGMRRL